MFSEIFSLDERKQELAGIALIAWGIFSAVALYGGAAGAVGVVLEDFYLFFFGQLAFFLPVCFGYAGIKLIIDTPLQVKERLLGFVLLFLSVIALYHLSYEFANPLEMGMTGEGGGLIGGLFSSALQNLFGVTGSQVILFTLALIGILLFLDIFLREVITSAKLKIQEIINSIKSFFSGIKSLKPRNLWSGIKSLIGRTAEREEAAYQPPVEAGEAGLEEFERQFSGTAEERTDAAGDIFSEPDREARKKALSERRANSRDDSSSEQPAVEAAEVRGQEAAGSESNGGDKGEQIKLFDDDFSQEDYQIPPINLLTKNKNRLNSGENQSEKLEKTLNNFGVEARVVNVSQGPTITRYEVQPETGVKVSKVANLSDDIALSLAAQDVRIEAPVPGKSVIGIEIPNQGSSLVRFREIAASQEFQNARKNLPLGLGCSIDGKPVVADLSSMPHLLIAGATGSGKSVCINSIIASFLYRFTPRQIKLLLIDPKKVELVNFKGLPHLFTPVVTDSKKAAGTLKLIVEEMEKRYELFAETGNRDIYSYNNQAEEPLPFIVVIIDELSDLMMVAASEVEDSICRLAQMSRAAGIHLVIATQRPSVDVITGLIKANIPSRIAFAVSSNTDSRTILDTKGAEKLLGNGDMLFYPVGAKKPHRMQGAYIESSEVKEIVEFVRNQSDPEFALAEEELEDIELDFDSDEDELLEDAIRLVVEYRASISMLQRRLHIGHSRAARLIDKMEEMGVVGPYAGSKPREVLISEEELEEYLD